MEDFEKIYIDGIFVIAVNVCRSTIKEASAFRKLIEEELNTRHTKLVIDLTKCEHIDSTFFGSIIMALNMTNDIGEKLKVVKPANTPEDIFLMTNTIEIFDLFETREDAIKSFESDTHTLS